MQTKPIKKKRKVRSDKKYKYRKKNGKMQPYTPKRERSDPLKIWWWKEEEMPPKSIRRIPRKLRATARKVIYKKQLRVDVDAKELSTKANIENLALISLGKVGVYLLMMFCHAKNRFGVSPKKVAKVVISNTSKGLKAKVIEVTRLQRYWFWAGGK